MEEIIKEVVKLANAVNGLVNINITMATRMNQQDALIVSLQERVAALEALQSINKAMLH